MEDLKRKLILSFHSSLLSSFGNDRDFDHDLSDELADVAMEEIKTLSEQNEKLREGLEYYRSITDTDQNLNIYMARAKKPDLLIKVTVVGKEDARSTLKETEGL
jgi:hypothetical protein